MNNNEKIRLVRYLGTHLKRTRHTQGLAKQCETVIRAGFELCLVLSRPPDKIEWQTDFEEIGVKLRYIDRPRSAFDRKCIASAVALFREFRPAIVHCENMHLIPMLAAKIARVKGGIWQKRAMNTATEELREFTLRDKLAPTTRLTAMMASRIVCVSKVVAAELAGLGIDKNKLIVLNNPSPGYDRSMTGVDYARRESFGLSDRDIVAVTIGHAVPVKGWAELIDGFAQISEEAPRLKLLIVGSVDDHHELDTMRQLRATIDAHRLRERIVFTGHLDDVDDALMASDFFVLSSRAEGYCNALVEAFARAIPCISTRVGIAPELIKDRINGRLVDRGSVEGIAGAMRELALDVGMRESMREQAQWPDWIMNRSQHSTALAKIYSDVYSEISPIGKNG